MIPSLKADSIQLKDLSSAVDKAVKLVAEKHKVTFETGLAINPAIINGRLLREALTDFNAVQALANEITAQVNAGHTAGAAVAHTYTPTVLWQKGRIICGFVAQPPAIFLAE